jgi:hypothetical protein
MNGGVIEKAITIVNSAFPTRSKNGRDDSALTMDGGVAESLWTTLLTHLSHHRVRMEWMSRL